MGAAIVGPSPIKSMKLWKYHCRPAVRDAEVGWKSAKPFLSSKPRFRNRGWSALSFVFLSGAAGVADTMQGRHPRQTSDALGSASSQLGPRALALATQLNKGLGLPYGKTATVLQQAFGLKVSRGGVCQALARVASKAEPTYHALVEEVRRSASVTRMKPVGEWVESGGGCGPSALRRSPSIAFSQAADSNKRPRCSGRTLQDSWCATAGTSIVSLSTLCTKPAIATAAALSGRWILVAKQEDSRAPSKPSCRTLGATRSSPFFISANMDFSGGPGKICQCAWIAP